MRKDANMLEASYAPKLDVRVLDYPTNGKGLELAEYLHLVKAFSYWQVFV